jgi:hypothetical protein
MLVTLPGPPNQVSVQPPVSHRRTGAEASINLGSFDMTGTTQPCEIAVIRSNASYILPRRDWSDLHPPMSFG